MISRKLSLLSLLSNTVLPMGSSLSVKRHPHSIAAIANLALLSTLSALPAHALQIITPSVSFDSSISLTDYEGGSDAVYNNASLGTSSLNQFNPSLGVLISATLNLDSTRTQTTSVTSTDGRSIGGSYTLTIAGYGESFATLKAPGIDHTFSEIILRDYCTNHRYRACANGAQTSSTDTALSEKTYSLNNYVGGGTVNITREASLHAVYLGSSVPFEEFTGIESTHYTLDWEGTLSLSYGYQFHAMPSFDGSSTLLTLDLDFGTVFLGDVADLGFRIYNPMGDRVGLDLDNFSGNGDTHRLTTNLSSFNALTAGSSRDFLANLNTSTIGAYSANYMLNFSDANVGASSSRSNYQMSLNLKGTVVGRSTSVPEPGTLILLGTSLLGLCFSRRKI